MPGVLAGGSAAVMTGGAITGSIAVIESDVPPTRCGVAVIALVITSDMAWCLTARSNAVMTLFTALWRAGEETILMAAGALHIPMPAGQGKAGGKVVEMVSCGIQILTLKADPQE